MPTVPCHRGQNSLSFILSFILSFNGIVADTVTLYGLPDESEHLLVHQVRGRIMVRIYAND